MYLTKERVVNLTDKATSKYLKVALTLEFIDTKLKDPPKGAAVLAQQTEFAAEMSPLQRHHRRCAGDHVVEQMLGGPDQTRRQRHAQNELMDNVNHALHDEEKVVNVYFTSFIIQ